MEALERGDAVTPYFSIGLADMGDLLAVLTPRRWQVLRVLREQGSASIAELADRLGDDADSLTEDIDTLRKKEKKVPGSNCFQSLTLFSPNIHFKTAVQSEVNP
ncbi:putative transcriptional regulator [Thiorhodovibrio winogradskyi]|uniref:Transcriptional regulator n=2 Tax=Thiorhodovibrio winogradskyi TaxID=77007 RepID=A0ABZ0SCI4_9GAMM